MKYLFYFIIVLSFQQCTQPITNPLNEPEKKLVISSFFTADEPMTVWVGYPHDILIDTLLYEANAMVKLYEDGQFIENLNHTLEGHYQSNYYLKTGKTYRIEVETDELSASAEDEIPEQVLADSAFYEFVELPDWNSFQRYQFVFQDIPNVDNYYEFLLLTTNYNEFDDLWGVGFVSSVRKNDPILENEISSPFLFSDKLIGGQRYEINLDTENGSSSDTSHNDLNLGFIVGDYKNYLVFRTISKTYFDFQKSWKQHYDNQNTVAFYNNTPDVGMASFSEVQPLYTNIENGYGIFVAYQEQIIPFEE